MTAVLNEMRRSNRLITKEAVFYYCANNKGRYACLVASGATSTSPRRSQVW